MSGYILAFVLGLILGVVGLSAVALVAASKDNRDK